MGAVVIDLEFLYRLKFEGKSVEWCFEKGYLGKDRKCGKCGCAMKLVDRLKTTDGVAWRCQKGGINAHYVHYSIRKGSWFSGSKLPIITILQLTYMWVYKCTNQFACKELKVSEATAVDWFSFCREVCVETCIRKSDKLGGVGKIVEIDESMFGKRKYGRGSNKRGKWVFVGIERESQKCFFYVVKNRTKKIILEIIKERILPGTTIISDSFKTYDCLSDEGFKHLTVNHKITFKNPETGAHTNTIEGTWSALKRSLQGTRQSSPLFDSYLFEYVWRKERKEERDLFSEFMGCALKIYDPQA